MTIAIDAGDMDVLRGRLREATESVGEAVPRMPGGAAFGPAVLAGAAASFESAMRRDAQRLRDRWAALDAGVRDTFDDMSEVEAEIIAKLDRTPEGTG